MNKKKKKKKHSSKFVKGVGDKVLQSMLVRVKTRELAQHGTKRSLQSSLPSEGVIIHQPSPGIKLH